MARRIADSGRAWRYDEVVEALLYDPGHGFYGSGRGRAGRRGDFLTSPEVGPLFGQVLARYLDSVWSSLGRPSPFVVAEAGAGVGTLARSLLAARSVVGCGGALEYVAVEVAAPLRAQHPPGVRSLAGLPERADVVLANELLDNLPFRLVEADGGGWREVLVGREGEVGGPLVEDDRLPPGPGGRLPLQDGAVRWLAAARDRAQVVLVIDYGVTTADLAARPWTEWLRTYRGHDRGGHPLEDPGSQDVTCEVAWDQLPPPSRHWRQADFLRAHGIDELVEEGRRLWQAGASVADLAALGARSRVREAEALSDPAGLGAFDVLEWHRD